ncbi:fungal specific transcription factor domain-containing protein [Hirsutella rhossiliensis]|uniref:Fungal specific transcription factor domain-containing protein n=1 Tax=Hirsutella rhossiliensis TaxID=111463 RepID=A0A9P8SE87_9HYPO|nr:fungal specific transcription factor domain-containing protein [Hirsutella rhossiliensis]KAH0958714.1 fungal specific transcription factor domain-containing protein [Hirsutella rhossiliensis]
MASQTPDRHACHCGKSFLRKEHLRRHQATHGGPTFSCQVCGRSFSRSDLLRRHAGIHGGAAAVPDSRRGKACDTCHANKTKCDGGPQCSLCAKRGVACTYGRRDAAAAGATGSSPPTKRVRISPTGPDDVSGPGPVSASAPVSPPFTESSGTTPSLAAISIFAGLPPCASPAASTTSSSAGQQQQQQQHNNNSATWAALQSIHRAVVSRSDAGPNGPPPSPSPVPKLWLSACVDSYFSTVHQRWPVLHGPGTDETTDEVAIVASIVMMTSWLHCDRSFKPLLMEIHNVLVEQAFKQLANDTFDPSRPWPAEIYQVALLNIIFAFESGRSRHLLSLLIAVLRQNGCFSAEAVERERNTHYPGDFVPWVFASVERWKRLAFCTFQVDTYLSLLCNQPPLLRREELDLGLPSTFAMWNAFGLHIFFPRHRSEPWRRGALKMSCLDMTNPQLLPSGILVEDVHACLLGAWNDIWILQQLRRNRHDAAAARADAIARQLKVCKIQLDAIVEATDRPDLHGQYTDFLIRAYSAKELPTEPKWRERVQARIHSYAFSVRMLYHLLNLHLRADVQAMRDVSHTASSMPGPESGGGATSPSWQRKVMQIQEWAMSSDSRAALFHAMFVWRTYQESAPALDLHQNPPDPIVYMALSAAAMVLWTWTMNAVPACICGPDVPKIDVSAGPLSAESSADIDDWVLRGGSGIMLHGATVCNCNAATWLTRFAEALARGGERWELGSIAANNCLSRLNFP